MNAHIPPNECPKCGWPTIGNTCENPNPAACDWSFTPSLMPINPESQNSNSSQVKMETPNIAPFPSWNLKPGKSRPSPGNSEPVGNQTRLGPTPFSGPSPPSVDSTTPNRFEERLVNLENMVLGSKSLESLKSHLLNKLDARLGQRFEEQDQLISTEVSEALVKQKPEIQEELKDFAKDEITAQIQPAFEDGVRKIADEQQSGLNRIFDVQEAGLRKIVTEQIDVQLVAEGLEARVANEVQQNFKNNFAEQFRLSLDGLLLSKDDFVELKKNIVSHPKGNRQFKLLEKAWYWLSGSSVELLSQCPESEVKKYQVLGMTMFIPMTMGWFACFHLMRQHLTGTDAFSLFWLVAIPLIWALTIMSIDRILLVSYRADTNWRGRWTQFGWRFFIALLFAVIFDASLLPTVFATDVDKAIEHNRQGEIQKTRQEYANKLNSFFDIKEAGEIVQQEGIDSKKSQQITTRLNQLSESIDSDNGERIKASGDAECEKSGGPSCKRGTKQGFDAAKAREHEANERIRKAKSEQERLQTELDSLNLTSVEREEKKAQLRSTGEYQQEKDKASDELENCIREIKASSPSEENKIVFGLFRDAWTDGNWLTVAIFLSYLVGFILVDTFPILMKFFMPRGLYDYLLEAQDKSAGSTRLGKVGVGHDNAKATGFRHTDLGFEITEMRANFDPKKSYTVWPVIQQILEAQLDQYIRENWRNHQDVRSGDPDQMGNYGFASYSISIGSPPQD